MALSLIVIINLYLIVFSVIFDFKKANLSFPQIEP